MGELMSVSKRLRYEILRRDNHQCRYCGGAAPDVKLTVDHVVPVSLGGGDEASNLVAACRDCNAGKSSSVPSTETMQEIADKQEELQEAKRNSIGSREAEQAIKRFSEVWTRGTLPANWERSLEIFVEEGMSADHIIRMAEVAQRKTGEVGWRWSYFCGCCWRRIKDAKQPVHTLEPTAQLKTKWTRADFERRMEYTEQLTGSAPPPGLCSHGEDCLDPVCLIEQAAHLRTVTVMEWKRAADAP